MLNYKRIKKNIINVGFHAMEFNSINLAVLGSFVTSKIKWISLVSLIFTLNAFAVDSTVEQLSNEETITDTIPLYTVNADSIQDSKEKSLAKALEYAFSRIKLSEIELNTEENCESVIYDWYHNSNQKCTLKSSVGMFGGCMNPVNLLSGFQFDTKTWITVSAYCKARSDKNIGPTLRTHINKPKIIDDETGY